MDCIVHHRAPELHILLLSQLPKDILKYILSFLNIDISLVLRSYERKGVYNQFLFKNERCIRCKDSNVCYKCCECNKRRSTYCEKYKCYECKDSGYKCDKCSKEPEPLGLLHCCNQCGNYQSDHNCDHYLHYDNYDSWNKTTWDLASEYLEPDPWSDDDWYWD